MNPIRIGPTSRPFHRYTPEEMSGALPPAIYKVLPERFARSLVARGEMMWSTLAYFQKLEEFGRGDETEGRHTYFPLSGLEINRIERAGLPDKARMILPGHGVVSRAAQPQHIFIYSLTLDQTLDIGDAADRSCVEIFDPPQFLRRIQDTVSQHPKVRVQTLIHNMVQYWSAANSAEGIGSLPDKLTMHKRDDYRQQKEYRLAFGIRPSVFDFENVDYFIVNQDTRWASPRLDEQAHRMRVRIGSLEDCCRLV